MKRKRTFLLWVVGFTLLVMGYLIGCHSSKNAHNKHYGKMKNKHIKVKHK